MTAFHLVDLLPDVAAFPTACECPGDGPWDVTVTIGGTLNGASVHITHVACGRDMELPDWLDVNADNVPMRLTVMSTVNRGPDDFSWFELAPRDLDIRVIHPSDELRQVIE